MKQSVATARLYQQTLEKIDPKCRKPRLKASPSSQLMKGTASKNEERKRV
jgi:hypothetical protein